MIRGTIPCFALSQKGRNMLSDKNNGKIHTFPADTVILSEGNEDYNMYKILRGNAELYTGYGTENEVLLGIIGPQRCFGEFGLLQHKKAIYTVVAYTDVTVLRIGEGEIGEFVQNNHRNIVDIMRNMARMMLIMQQQIDLMSREIKEGKDEAANPSVQVHRNLREYAVCSRIEDHFDYLEKAGFFNGRKKGDQKI